MGGFRWAQVGFKSPWVGMGPLVLVSGHGFARHGPLQVLGLVVVAENGSDFGFFCFLFLIIIIWVCGYGFGSGGC